MRGSAAAAGRHLWSKGGAPSCRSTSRLVLQFDKVRLSCLAAPQPSQFTISTANSHHQSCPPRGPSSCASAFHSWCPSPEKTRRGPGNTGIFVVQPADTILHAPHVEEGVSLVSLQLTPSSSEEGTSLVSVMALLGCLCASSREGRHAHMFRCSSTQSWTRKASLG